MLSLALTFLTGLLGLLDTQRIRIIHVLLSVPDTGFRISYRSAN